MNEGIHVTGLVELMGALKALSPEAQKRLAGEMKDIARHVVERAQAKMEFGSGTAASSVKPGGNARGAWISFPRGGPGSGGDKAGYYPWLDFGGGAPFGRGVTASDRVGHKKTDWTGVGYAGFRRPTTLTGGRYIYPAIGESKWFIEAAGYRAIKDAADVLRLEVR